MPRRCFRSVGPLGRGPDWASPCARLLALQPRAPRRSTLAPAPARAFACFPPLFGFVRSIPTQREEARTLQFSAAKGQKNSQLECRESLKPLVFPETSARRAFSCRPKLRHYLNTVVRDERCLQRAPAIGLSPWTD